MADNSMRPAEKTHVARNRTEDNKLLYSLVRTWIIHNKLDVAFTPSKSGLVRKGAILGAWDHHFLLQAEGQEEPRVINEWLLVSLIGNWMIAKGYAFGLNYVAAQVREWTWERYNELVPTALANAGVDLRPRIEVKKKAGRPRKDGSTTTYRIVPAEPELPLEDAAET